MKEMMNMKKILSILSIALLGAVACQKLGPDGPFINTPDEGSEMTLYFSIPVDPQTKGGMTEAPSIDPATSTVHVLVFNANSGALLEAPKAELLGSITQNTSWTATEANYKTANFKAVVTMGSAPRYLHFIVDAPTYEPNSNNSNDTGLGTTDHRVYIGDSESSVAAKLFTTDGVTAYWQRIFLANGLTAYTYPGGRPALGTSGTDWEWHQGDDFYVDANQNTVSVGDYVNEYGHKITDGSGYYMSSEVAALVKHVPVVRNFVQINISAAEGNNFKPSKAVLINVPKSGYVAPYSAATGFVSYYLKQEHLSDLPTDPTASVAGTGYTAPVPNDAIVTTCPDVSACVAADADGVIKLYMYERGRATKNPVQLLVQGTLNGSTKWLKMDITDQDGQYIAFYRDLSYKMEIGTLTGISGYSSMPAAYKAPSIGNPSSSPETATLNQVSDGKGVGIWVDYIDYASFSTDATTQRLRYKFWDAADATSADVTFEITHSTGDHAVTVNTLTGQPYSGADPTQDGQGGWYYVDVPLAGQGSTVMHSTVRVSGTGVNSAGKSVTLYRDVTYSVMTTQTLGAKIEGPATGAPAGTTHSATITLPDGLSYSLFPLIIRIEADKGSINPTDSDLPVNSGTSTFSVLPTSDSQRKTTNAFWFEKTISFKEYNEGARDFTANFKTVFDSGNATTVLFSDPDGHFTPVKAQLQ